MVVQIAVILKNSDLINVIFTKNTLASDILVPDIEFSVSYQKIFITD